MKKIIILFALILMIYPQTLLRTNFQSEDEIGQIVLPATLFSHGREVTINDCRIDLGKLREQGGITMDVDRKKMLVSVEPYKIKILDPKGKYGKFKLTVKGKDAVSINLPLWLLKGIFCIVKPFMQISRETRITRYKGAEIKYEREDEEAVETAGKIMDFISSPHKFIGGYAGPIHFIHVEEKDQIIDIVLQKP